jgi:hypothetical protein
VEVGAGHEEEEEEEEEEMRTKMLQDEEEQERDACELRPTANRNAAHRTSLKTPNCFSADATEPPEQNSRMMNLNEWMNGYE